MFFSSFIFSSHQYSVSDERAEGIISTALKNQESIKQRNSIAVVAGINGAGKSCVISRFFGINPPDVYSSTGIADRSYRGLAHHIASLGFDSWELLLGNSMLEICAPQLPLVPEASSVPGSAAAPTTTPTTTTSQHQVRNPVSVIQSFLRKLRFTSSRESDLSPSSSPSSSQFSSHAADESSSQPLLRRSRACFAMMHIMKHKRGTEPSVVHLLHMIDTGGQPEFMEVIPSLLHNSNLSILVLNLAQGLDVYPEIAFYEEGKATIRPNPSSLTNRQIIQRLARTMQAKITSQAGGKHSKIIVIGTHRDCVKKEEVPAVLAVINKALKEIFSSSLQDMLIVNVSLNEIVFPVNSIDPDTVDLQSFDTIRHKISQCTAKDDGINTPISFFMFEQDVMELAQQLQREVLSRQECLQIGRRLQMSEEVVQAALIYFHQRTIFMYFQHVLPNVVFVNPQNPLNVYKAIVFYSYQVKSGSVRGLQAKVIKLLEKACISESLLQEESFANCFHRNIFEPRDAIELFRYLYSISPLSEEEQQPANSQQLPSPCPPVASQGRQKEVEREYLMMSLLPDIPNNEIEKILPPSSNVSPLSIQFSGDCVPIGCFGNMIACAISQHKWSFNLKVHSPKHNIVTICPPDLPLNVTLVDSAQFLQVHINSNRLEEKDLLNFCRKIQSEIFSILKAVFYRMHFTNLEVRPAFLCSCNESSSLHLATACPDPRDGVDATYLICSETGDRQGKLEWRHSVWFEGCKEKRGENIIFYFWSSFIVIPRQTDIIFSGIFFLFSFPTYSVSTTTYSSIDIGFQDLL